jgi:amino acid transporter
MRLLPLLGATYFMVAGGPYGLEDIIGKAGYWRALVMLAIIPMIWSLPTSLMVGELASAIPAEGGYYVWVRRAMGRFWGFQEAWLSLAASVFDMAIYPTIFVLYLSRFAPTWTSGYRGTMWALAIVVGCALWNLTGAKAIGRGSVVLFFVLMAPFVVLIAAALWKVARPWDGRAAARGWSS